MISLADHDQLAVDTSITSIVEDEEEEEEAEETSHINNDDFNVGKPLKKTESVFVNKTIELSTFKRQDTTERGETLKSWQWNVGFIIRVHDRGENDKYGFTQRIAKRKAIKDEDDENYMMTYGPYRSSFANMKPLLDGNSIYDNDPDDDGAIILIATGAGASYMIETVLYLRGKLQCDPNFKLKRNVRIHFSGRSPRLFQWVTNFLTEQKIKGVKVFANLTSHKNIHNYRQDGGHYDKNTNAMIGRASFKDVLKQSPHKSKVFFCGHPRIQASIKLICKDLHFTFYEGHSFG